MNKLILIIFIIPLIQAKYISAKGGAVGLQLGKVTFGLGGSSNGPIIGIGRSPDNHLPIAVPFIPGDSNCCECSNCSK